MGHGVRGKGVDVGGLHVFRPLIFRSAGKIADCTYEAVPFEYGGKVQDAERRLKPVILQLVAWCVDENHFAAGTHEYLFLYSPAKTP